MQLRRTVAVAQGVGGLAVLLGELGEVVQAGRFRADVADGGRQVAGLGVAAGGFGLDGRVCAIPGHACR